MIPAPRFYTLLALCLAFSLAFGGQAFAQKMLWLPGVAALVVDPSLMAGAFLGILLASFIYLLSSWLAIREPSQIFLMLMLVCLVAHMAASYGYLPPALSANPHNVLFIQAGGLVLFYLCSTLFTLLFLEIGIIAPWLRVVLYAGCGVLVLALLIAAIAPLFFITTLLLGLQLAMLVLLLTAGVIGRLHRIGGSLAHLLAFSVVFTGTVIDGLKSPGSSQAAASGTASAIAYAMCAMLFAVVIASQFAKRQELKERELATSNERFKLAAEGSNEGLYDWDVVRQTGYFSERLKRIFGIPLIANRRTIKVWMKRIHPHDRQKTRHTLFAFLRDKTRHTISMDYRICHRQNQVAWIRSTGVALRHPQSGKVLRLIGSVGDITEKKRAEIQLKASEARFRSIAEAHPVPVLIATLGQGRVLYASHGAQGVFGLPLASLLQHGLGGFFVDAGQWQIFCQDIKSIGAVDLREAMLRRADGTSFAAALSARRIAYEGQECAVVGVNDITERLQAEAKIKEQGIALQQSEKLAALGGLLAGVAHELNNPLSVIVGQAMLLGESTADEKIARRAEKIHKAGERCARIIRSFLALARRKPPERVSVAINEVIEASLELLAFQLRGDNIGLTKQLSPSLPPVVADADQMTQVITNLVINAKQALQDKAGVRQVWVETVLDAAHNQVMLAVTDNGSGVPEALRKRIFEPFFTTKPAGSGTGVGLSLCFNVVEAHGGHIWVEDAQPFTGEPGARFVFTLPVAASTQEVVSHAATPAVPPPATMAIPPQRILIVDDEVELGATLGDILTPDGHSVTLVDNGQKALDAIATQEVEQQPYAIIISDLRMPVLDGPGLYAALAARHPHYLKRIIFVTGDTLSIPIRDFLAQYHLEVIEKPYSREDVRKKMVAVLKDNP